MNKGQKIGIIVASTLVAGGIAFPCIWTGVNWKKVHEIDPSKIYRQEDLQKAADEAVKDMIADNLDKAEKIAVLQNQIVELNVNIAEANAKVTAAQEQKQKDDKQLESLNTQINLLNETVTSLTNIKTANEQELAQKQARIVELENELANLSEDNEELTTELEQTCARVAELETANTQQVALLNNVNAQKAALQNQYNELVAETSDSVNTINNLNLQIANLQKDINYYAELLSAYQSETKAIATFKVKNNVYKLLVVEKGTAPSVEEPTLDESESFLGWVIEGTDEVVNLSEITITEDTTFVAKLTVTHVVKLYDGDSYQTKRVADGQKCFVESPTSTPKKVFRGWATTPTASFSEIVDLNATPITEARTFYAIYEYSYDVNFVIDGIENTELAQVVKQGQPIAKVTEPTKEGYDFLGWSIDGENVVDDRSYLINQDTTFIAVFGIKEYTVKFMNGEEQVGDDQIISINNKLTVPSNPTKTDYNFIGWTLDGTTLVDVEEMAITEDTTFIAKFLITFAKSSWSYIKEVSSQISSANMTSQQVYKNFGWQVGDTKSITLTNNQHISVAILGYNHDDLSNGGKAGISLGLTSLYKFTDSIDVDNCCYDNTSLRRALNSVFSLMPSDLGNAIVSVKKKSLSRVNGADEIKTTTDKLWLFSEIEITNSGKDEGAQYEYWQTVKDGSLAENRIKHYGSSANRWLLRSYGNSGFKFYLKYVSTSGSVSVDSHGSNYSLFGFCV